MLFYIWVLFFVCGGAVAFSIKPFKQWTGHNNSSNVDDLQVHRGLMQWRSYQLDLVDKSRGGTLLEGGKM